MQQKREQQILFLLKAKGPQTSQSLACLLQMTSMGARQHLQQLKKEALVEAYQESTGVGRPKQYWRLTATANDFFPNTHAHMTLELVDSIQAVFGAAGLHKIIDKRDRAMLKAYQVELQHCESIADKLCKLTEIRTREGYMAEYEVCKDGSYVLIENHCPICVAATHCQQFCKSELALFRALFAADAVTIKRESHIIKGARRCSYRIVTKDQPVNSSVNSIVM